VSARFAQRDFADRIRSLQSVDDAVARTFRHLRAAGVLGDTYVMFTSDNGYLIGEHRYIGKILPYEPALRVPLLVRGPGIAPGSHTASTVTTVDLASTITDLAGVTPGRTPDGVSLVPLLHGGPPPARDTTLIQAGGLGSGPRTAPWLYRGVRTARYTFAVWDDQGPPFPELYDRSVDPDELLNVADDPRYAAVVEALSARLQALQDCAGAACNTEFGPLPVVPHAVALRAVRGAD
jgi:arylsulfatase A-like enzyme